MGKPDESDPDWERSIDRFAVLVTLRAEFETGNDRALLETINDVLYKQLALTRLGVYCLRRALSSRRRWGNKVLG